MNTIAKGIQSLSIALLAGSIFYLGYALLGTADRVALMLAQSKEVAESLTPVVELAPDFLEESKQLRHLTAEVVAEVEAIRLQVPPILNESEAIRKTLPAILEQTERLRAESEKIRAEAASIRAQIPQVLAELQAYRALVPQVLEESRRIRETIPPTLNRVENIVLKADEVASTAGENVFTGVISGIFKAPIKLLGNVTDFLLPSNAELSENDQNRLRNRLQEFVNTAEIGDAQTFVTEDPSITLQYELLSKAPIDSKDCRSVSLTSRKSGKALKQIELQICRDDQGDWFLNSSK